MTGLKLSGITLAIFGMKVTPNIPQSKIAPTNFYESGGSQGEKLGEKSGEFFWAFSYIICCAE